MQPPPHTKTHRLQGCSLRHIRLQSPIHTATGMSDETKNARKKMAEEKARKKAEEAERIRKDNAEMKARS